jgi:hypothetical protein
MNVKLKKREGNYYTGENPIGGADRFTDGSSL